MVVVLFLNHHTDHIKSKTKPNQIKWKERKSFFHQKKTVATATTTATTTFFLFIININNIIRFTSSSWSIVIHFPLLLLPHKQKVHYFLFRQFFFLLVFIAFYFCFYFSAKKNQCFTTFFAEFLDISERKNRKESRPMLFAVLFFLLNVGIECVESVNQKKKIFPVFVAVAVSQEEKKRNLLIKLKCFISILAIETNIYTMFEHFLCSFS